MKRLWLLFALLLACYGQQVVLVNAPPPPTVAQISSSVIGQKGGAMYCYWVVARYTVGNSQLSPPSCVFNAPNTIDSQNYVRISWTGTGANSYDVVRQNKSYFPASGTCTNCLVASATTATVANDNVALTFPYTLASPVATVQGIYGVNNRDYATARSFIYPPLDCSSLVGGSCGGGGSGTPGGSNGDIQYKVDATTFGGYPIPLAVNKGGTGQTSPSLVAGTNVSITGSWPNQTINSSGSGGATQTANLLDFQLVKSSATLLNASTSCTAGTSCNFRVGRGIVTIAGGSYDIVQHNSRSGRVCTYFDSAGVYTLGYGNGFQSGDITSTTFPAVVFDATNYCGVNSDPLYTWDSASGVFAATGTDLRAFIGYTPTPIAGTGIQIVTGTYNYTVQIDTTTVAPIGSAYHSCIFENDTQSATPLTDAQITGHDCQIPANSTLMEVMVHASSGTPSLVLERIRPSSGATADLVSGALATGASGAYACAIDTTSTSCPITGITSSSSITLSNTTLLTGDSIRIKSATAGGVATWQNVTAWFKIN